MVCGLEAGEVFFSSIKVLFIQTGVACHCTNTNMYTITNTHIPTNVQNSTTYKKEISLFSGALKLIVTDLFY